MCYMVKMAMIAPGCSFITRQPCLEPWYQTIAGGVAVHLRHSGITTNVFQTVHACFIMSLN